MPAKIERLKNSEAFGEILKERQQLSSHYFTLHYRLHPLSTVHTCYESAVDNCYLKPLKIGFIVPKRLAKRAVQRNLIRRLSCAVFEALATELPQGDYIVRLRKGFDKQSWPSASSSALKREIREDLTRLFQRLSSQGSITRS